MRSHKLAASVAGTQVSTQASLMLQHAGSTNGPIEAQDTMTVTVTFQTYYAAGPAAGGFAKRLPSTAAYIVAVRLSGASLPHQAAAGDAGRRLRAHHGVEDVCPRC